MGKLVQSGILRPVCRLERQLMNEVAVGSAAGIAKLRGIAAESFAGLALTDSPIRRFKGVSWQSCASALVVLVRERDISRSNAATDVDVESFGKLCALTTLPDWCG